MTKTDKAFEESQPGFYIFDKPHKRHCEQCGTPFETSLELNRFCTPKHKKEFLERLTA